MVSRSLALLLASFLWYCTARKESQLVLEHASRAVIKSLG